MLTEKNNLQKTSCVAHIHDISISAELFYQKICSISLREKMNQRIAAIIGAGPAGLTVVYELLETKSIKQIVFEMLSDIGGISKIVNYEVIAWILMVTDFSLSWIRL